MRLFQYFTALLLTVISTLVSATSMWEAGQLTYPNGETEVSAFVNTPSDTQLQVVLCTNNSANDYRFTLLLPKKLDVDTVIKVVIKTDDQTAEEYAEISGNSLDIQVDEKMLLSMPSSPVMTFNFDEEDASFLGIDPVIEVNMSGADFTIRNVASQCTAFSLNKGYKANAPLLSALLWPVNRFEQVDEESIDDLCSTLIRSNVYKFNFTDSCKLALDRFYKKEGVGPLSFINKIFNEKESNFIKYQKAWNEAVSLSPYSALNLPVHADDKEWYLVLYSMVSKRKIREFPNSYYSIKHYESDPTTLVYDVDNRYEMEMLKYSAVLFRRVRGSVSAVNAVEKALKYWQEFYRELTATLPSIEQAQAVRPIVYRSMLMRVWNLAGKPEGLKLIPENIFRQGTGGKTLTSEPLEAKCSFFDGSNGEQFYFASDECIKSVDDYMRTSPLKTKLYKDVEYNWNRFSSNWVVSPFYNDSIDDAVGEHPQANLALAIMSMFKIYGFGDYFLVREEISSRDADICGYELHKLYNIYSKEFNYRLDSISNVSDEDGKKLNELNTKWLDYYKSLEVYLKDLVDKGLIPLWRADFVKSVAIVIQTNALLNFPYDRAELPDISLKEDDYVDETTRDGEKMSIESNEDEEEEKPISTDEEPSSDVEDDIIHVERPQSQDKQDDDSDGDLFSTENGDVVIGANEDGDLSSSSDEQDNSQEKSSDKTSSN